MDTVLKLILIGMRECKVVSDLWEGLFKIASKFFSVEMLLDKMEVLFGHFSKKANPLYILSMLIKKEIISCKWKRVLPQVEKVWSMFLHYARIEQLICQDKNQLLTFHDQWGGIEVLL